MDIVTAMLDVPPLKRAKGADSDRLAYQLEQECLSAPVDLVVLFGCENLRRSQLSTLEDRFPNYVVRQFDDASGQTSITLMVSREFGVHHCQFVGQGVGYRPQRVVLEALLVQGSDWLNLLICQSRPSKRPPLFVDGQRYVTIGLPSIYTVATFPHVAVTKQRVQLEPNSGILADLLYRSHFEFSDLSTTQEIQS